MSRKEGPRTGLIKAVLSGGSMPKARALQRSVRQLPRLKRWCRREGAAALSERVELDEATAPLLASLGADGGSARYLTVLSHACRTYGCRVPPSGDPPTVCGPRRVGIGSSPCSPRQPRAGSSGSGRPSGSVMCRSTAYAGPLHMHVHCICTSTAYARPVNEAAVVPPRSWGS